MSIEWKRYFDHIYCFHHVGNEKRLSGIRKELGRIGILESGIFSLFITSKEPYERFISERSFKCSDDEITQRSYVNVVLNTRRLYREALYFGYRRILIVEDDMRFLKDVEQIRTALDNMPPYDIVQLDKLVPHPSLSKNEYIKLSDNRKIDGHDGYFDGRNVMFTSAGCYAVTENAMRRLLCLTDRGLKPVDILFGRSYLSYAVADVNVGIQVLFDDAVEISHKKVKNTHHREYEPIGIRYEDYNVPQGYDYSKLCGDYKNE